LIKTDDDSTFEPGVKVRSGVKFAEEKKQRAKELEMIRNKRIKCKFLFEQGACRMGDKCYYSHEGYKAPAETKQNGGSSAYRGGMRGGRPMTSTTPFSSSDHSARIPSGASRGGRGGISGHNSVREEQNLMPRKPKVQKKQDCTDLESQISRINSDLMRLEPIRKRIDKKSLDFMFIIDCTGSMESWINTCK
jgi:hypothetical protein